MVANFTLTINVKKNIFEKQSKQILNNSTY